MKTIFRSLTIGLILGTIIALGAVAGFAQDPCTDADGQTTLGDKFRAEYPSKDIPGRRQAIGTGKQFLEKYGSCEPAKELSDYLKITIPKMEANLAKLVEQEGKTKMMDRFNLAYNNAKNWDEVYPSGKDLLAKYPDEFRDIELALGSIGYDESFKSNFKYNDETLRYAKLSIADLEAGKTFSANFGVGPHFVYKSKDNALGWMNLTIAYITQVVQKNKKDAQPYFYKASQLTSETKSNPIVYASMGSFYFDDVRNLVGEVDALIKTQNATDTEEVAKQKVEAIKVKVAMVNGTAEAAIDAYTRAYNLAKADTKTPKAYTDGLYKTMQDLYKVRFGKLDGFDAFIVNLVKKPLPNPTQPVAPIRDPEPAVKTTPTTPVKPPVTTPAKPAVTTPVKKPVSNKPVVKKKGA